MDKQDPAPEIDSMDGATGSLPAATEKSQAVAGEMSVTQAVDLLARSGAEFMALLDPRTGEVTGVLLKPDTPLPQTAAPEPPRLGGMATPLGVYLHDGISGGGAGFFGLVLTGMLISSLGVVAQIATSRIDRLLSGALAHTGSASRVSMIFGPDGFGVDQLFLGLFSVCLLLSLVRLLPLAGTHAAEHQVVHCVERGVPLTPRDVKLMPRVHPRCGTNLLTGMLIFLTAFSAVFRIAVYYGQELHEAASLGAIVAVPLALAYWRRVGGFMQYWFATKPATDRQIAGAIKAAEQVFARRSERTDAPIPFRAVRRIWAMGFPQVLIGYSVIYVLLQQISAHWPSIGAMLEM